MRKIANFILGTIVCLTVLGIIMFFTLYISLIIANENPPSDDAMFRMIQKTYGVDVTQYSPDVLYKSYDTNIREDYWAMLLNISTSNNDELSLDYTHTEQKSSIELQKYISRFWFDDIIVPENLHWNIFEHTEHNNGTIGCLAVSDNFKYILVIYDP